MAGTDCDCVSDTASSVCDEERIRKLFQACDTNGDGFIDSQDLLLICQELSLEDSIDELMKQLGADAQGRISYEQFLRRRLALRPEIDALKNSKHVDVASDNSQGKLDQWEWDSGARDMSPVPKSLAQRGDRSETITEEEFKERLQQHLDEQAQRYEEQLTELHSVIAELTRKLHQQRIMAIAEEDEISEIGTTARDDSITCPLDISELDLPGNDMSDSDKVPKDASDIDFKHSSSPPQENSVLSPYSEVIESLQKEITRLRAELLTSQMQLAEYNTEKREVADGKDGFKETRDQDSKVYGEDKVNIKYGNIVSTNKAATAANVAAVPSVPLTKIAERVKLKRAADSRNDINPSDLSNSDLPTTVAEHIVGDILCQCDVNYESQAIDIEMKRLVAKLEHVKSQNMVLALTLNETKANCDRLALLCGKYESNAVALHLALAVTDRAIEAYDVLLALLETELALNQNNPESVEDRIAAESVAKQLLAHLDSHRNTESLLSPWQHHAFNSSNIISEAVWTQEHENRLRKHVSHLKAERTNIQGTCVILESPHVEMLPVKPVAYQENKKMDLEMAVLMQELMGLREDRAELITKLFKLEREKNAIEMKLKYVEGQQKAQAVTLKNLQDQLKDTEALLAAATQNKERGHSLSDAEHAQGVELELMQALAREARLKIRLQELVSALEQVTKNAEARLLEGKEIVQDLNQTNSILSETIDKNHKKYQARLKKMEQQLGVMADQHSFQVRTLQSRIVALETPLTDSSKNSVNSTGV